jgi:flavin-dependent dehydrogenase
MADAVTHAEVVVVGGRCAGAATARLLAARGHEVVVLERALLPSDTLSTHGLARGGVVQLQRWGLLDQVLDDGAPAVREVTFGAGGAEQTRPLRERAGVDLLVAPRRHRLDGLLAREAAGAGAEVRTGVTATGVLHRDGRVAGVAYRDRTGATGEVRARYVVAADGVRSATARRVGARTLHATDQDVALYYTYVTGLPWRGYEFHVAPEAFAGVFPTHDGRSCVWLTRPTRHQRALREAGADRTSALLTAIAAVAPALGERLRGAAPAEPVRGWIAPPSYLREAHGPGWAAVGDAGYFRDPITGHGITDAFRDAELLADALHAALDGADESAALRGYQAQRDLAVRDTLRITEALCRFPAPARFVELQLELAEALDREALDLASRPAPVRRTAAPAA